MKGLSLRGAFRAGDRGLRGGSFNAIIIQNGKPGERSQRLDTLGIDAHRKSLLMLSSNPGVKMVREKQKFSLLIPMAICVAIFTTSFAFAHEPEKKPDRGPKNTGSVLVFAGTGWYRHPETAAISGWLARLSDDLQMQVDVSESPRDIETLLDRYDVLVLNNANELTKLFDEKQRAKVEQWYEAGGGIVALHAALVHQTEWKWFSELAGCDFNSDSEYLEARIIVDPNAKDHPAIHGAGESFLYKADWTNHDRSVTGLPGFQVLLRVDESTYDPVRDYFKERGGKGMGKDHPIAWTNTLNNGRFFYTELGHDVRSLETKFGRKHIIEAIHWAARKGEPADKQESDKNP